MKNRKNYAKQKGYVVVATIICILLLAVVPSQAAEPPKNNQDERTSWSASFDADDYSGMTGEEVMFSVTVYPTIFQPGVVYHYEFFFTYGSGPIHPDVTYMTSSPFIVVFFAHTYPREGNAFVKVYKDQYPQEYVIDYTQVHITQAPLSPTDSEVILTTENPLVTCPQADGPALDSLRITLRDANGCPIRNVPSSSFSFSITTNSDTLYFGTPDCTFVPLSDHTNNQEVIEFAIVGDTSMSGTIYIHVRVNDVTLINHPKLDCISYDINCDGAVNLGDISLFAQDYYNYNERSDFSWDGVMNLADIASFTLHRGHH